LVYCADCHEKMRHGTTSYFEKRKDHFVCFSYRSNTGTCSAHFIRAVILEDMVWKHMQGVIGYVLRYEDHFRSEMEQMLHLESESALKTGRKELAAAEKRIGELDRPFMKLYEDNAGGKISDERFSTMSKSYEDEQQELKERTKSLQETIEVQSKKIDDLNRFVQRVKKYSEPDSLTPYALRELIKRRIRAAESGVRQSTSPMTLLGTFRWISS